ncbi:Hypothetical predicted protein [Mytilus galloprovincialis]|uniref:3CxxC-type domain-containing protein n=1 Tax=Mytilus galloprovincialis TaxID=29158 RepID=A0A8B6EV97_MYTGA|nr:Hypothetical predicted protein [Mytilus galloprovincialis]
MGRRNNRRESSQREVRCFGYFCCRSCDHEWTSSYVWKMSGTLKVLYKQQCMECDEFMGPYKTTPLICSGCGMVNCECQEDNSGPKKPHLSDLCGRCQSGKKCQLSLEKCVFPCSRRDGRRYRY